MLEKVTAYKPASQKSDFHLSRDVDKLIRDERKKVLGKYIKLRHELNYEPYDWEAPTSKKNIFGQKLHDPEAFQRGVNRGLAYAKGYMYDALVDEFVEFYDDIQRELKKVEDNAKAIQAKD